MSTTTCVNCGSKEYNGYCTNCDEEVYIVEQYDDLGMELPSEDTDFMKRYRESIKNNN